MWPLNVASRERSEDDDVSCALAGGKDRARSRARLAWRRAAGTVERHLRYSDGAQHRSDALSRHGASDHRSDPLDRGAEEHCQHCNDAVRNREGRARQPGADLSRHPAAPCADEKVRVNELISGVNALLNGCTSDATATRTATSQIPTPTHTSPPLISTSTPSPMPTPEVGRLVSFTPPPTPNVALLGLPREDDGTHLVLEIPGVALRANPDLRDPATAFARCIRWIMECAQAGAGSLDDCARSAPVCQTEEPWEEAAECCPAACFEAYIVRRLQGQDDFDSFDQVYLTEHSCFPGLLEP